MPVLKILTTISLKGLLDELSGTFRQQTGHDLDMTFGPAGTQFDKVRSGTAYDIVIVVPYAIDTMIAEGYVEAGSQQDFTKSISGVAVKAGTPHPTICTVENFKQALLDAKSVGYTNPATKASSGVHVAKILGELGIADVVNAKTTFGQGGSVAELLITGEIEIALQQISEHLLVEGVEVVGPLPDKIQLEITLASGVHTQVSDRHSAATMINLLTSPDTHPILQRNGLFPLT